MDRPIAKEEIVKIALEDVAVKLYMRMATKGRRIFMSSHEVGGIIDEELMELKDAIQKNEKIDDELLDIAVAAIWGYVSSKSGKMDW